MRQDFNILTLNTQLTMQKKNLLWFTLPLLVSCTSGPQLSPEEVIWQRCDSVLRAIQVTAINVVDFNITDYGALAIVEGRDSMLVHDAINAAIKAANAAGGGRVVIPDSTYFTGPITLLSDVDLHLEDGAILTFSTNPELYYPAVKTRWEGVDCYNAHPLIYAIDAENFCLSGKGILDAQGSNDNWWAMCGARRYGWKEGMISQSGRDGVKETSPRQKLLDWCTNQVPIEERQMTMEDGMRPQFVNFVNCKRVLIEDVTLLNSPFWVLHPLFCEDLVVSHVTVVNDGPNGDGCDPECCNRVLIQDCVFHTGDDCIAIKSGRNQDGRNQGVPSQNIIVRNCKMADGHGGVVIGSEIAGGYRNLWVENCEMDSPNLDRVIRIKTSSARGGIIENVYVRNITVGRCREAVLRINLNYDPKEIAERGHNPIVRNVNLQNVTCQESQYAVVFNGLDDECLIYDINLKDCEWNGVKGGKKANICDSLVWAEGLYRNIQLENVMVNGNPLPVIENSLPKE